MINNTTRLNKCKSLFCFQQIIALFNVKQLREIFILNPNISTANANKKLCLQRYWIEELKNNYLATKEKIFELNRTK